MRTSCDRSDINPKSQARDFPRTRAFPRKPRSGAINYNRLEYDAEFGRGRTLQSSFLSLVQVPKSCHKQGWRITPFRRGIA